MLDHLSMAFINDVCSACIGTLAKNDCMLWKAFTHRKMTIWPRDIAIIENGLCPFSVKPPSLGQGQEPEPNPEAGKVLAAFIGKWLAEEIE